MSDYRYDEIDDGAAFHMMAMANPELIVREVQTRLNETRETFGKLTPFTVAIAAQPDWTVRDVMIFLANYRTEG